MCSAHNTQENFFFYFILLFLCIFCHYWYGHTNKRAPIHSKHTVRQRPTELMFSNESNAIECENEGDQPMDAALVRVRIVSVIRLCVLKWLFSMSSVGIHLVFERNLFRTFFCRNREILIENFFRKEFFHKRYFFNKEYKLSTRYFSCIHNSIKKILKFRTPDEINKA